MRPISTLADQHHVWENFQAAKIKRLLLLLEDIKNKVFKSCHTILSWKWRSMPFQTTYLFQPTKLSSSKPSHHDLEWQRWQKNPYWHLCIITREEPNLCFWLSQCLVCQSNKASYTFTNFCVSQYGLQELELHHHTYDHKYKCQRAKEGSKKRRRFFRLSSIQRGRPGISSLVCNIIRRQ